MEEDRLYSEEEYATDPPAPVAAPLARRGVRWGDDMEDNDRPLVRRRSSLAAAKRGVQRRDDMEEDRVESEEEDVADQPAPLSPMAAPAIAPAPTVVAAPLPPHAAAISDDLLERFITAFAEDIASSHEHQ